MSKPKVGMQVWDIERDHERGVRAIAKVWPQRRGGLPRFRLMRGRWHKTGNERRDYYISQVGLQRRVKELEGGVARSTTEEDRK